MDFLLPRRKSGFEVFVYKNIGEKKGNIGLYPYEPIKEIHKEISSLGFGNLDKDIKIEARIKIIQHWKSIRQSFLSEFDRAEPSNPIIEQ